MKRSAGASVQNRSLPFSNLPRQVDLSEAAPTVTSTDPRNCPRARGPVVVVVSRTQQSVLTSIPRLSIPNYNSRGAPRKTAHFYPRTTLPIVLRGPLSLGETAQGPRCDAMPPPGGLGAFSMVTRLERWFLHSVLLATASLTVPSLIPRRAKE